jgi:hypothetical protein
MRNFNVTIVYCSYMFRLQSNNHQAVYRKFKKEISLYVFTGRWRALVNAVMNLRVP